MDSREAPPPPQQQQQQPNLMVGPNSYSSPPPIHPNSNTNSSSTAMIGGPNSGRYQFNPVAQQQQQQPGVSKVMDVISPNPFDGSLRPCGPAGAGGVFAGVESITGKKKRGRPRKYSLDGSNIALGLTPNHVGAASAGGDSVGEISSDPPVKKQRGRPPGLGKKQHDALGGAGGTGFMAHVITVQTGEDVATKLMNFSQQGPRTICILSATGSISSATIRQPSKSTGTVTYEGRYEIISLTGSYMFSENNGNHSRSGNLNVSLSGSDGAVLGGPVSGTLVAAGPIQVILASFIWEGKKSSSNLVKSGTSSPPPAQMLNFGAPMTAASPSSQGGGSTGSSDENGSSPPLNRVPTVLYANRSQPMQSMQMYQLWAEQTQQ